MRKLLVITAAVLLSMSPIAMANGGDDGCDDECGSPTNITIKGNKVNGGDADARAKAEADARARAKADADARAYAHNTAKNTAIQLGYVEGGDQYTKVYNDIYNKVYNTAKQQQGQAQLGIVSNHGPQVVLEDHSVVNYEAAASSAIAPAGDAPPPTAGCRYAKDYRLAGSVIVGSGSAGYTSSEYDAICGTGELAARTEGNAKKVATLVNYCLTMEEAEVETSQCVDWRGKAKRGLDAAGNWIPASAKAAGADVETEEVVLRGAQDR